jgi:serine/threonine protein kinase/tetratricopeptide (TPR) repeat protein
MGAVYRAVSTREGPAGPAGSVVAIKVFHPHLVAEDRAVDRFRREAEIGRQIRHPNVVRTYDVGTATVEEKTLHYMVMELIEGQTLAGLMKELGTVPGALLTQIADQALGALEEIHARGIVHRDIKPENIVITPDHRVLVMDLGVARLLEEGHALTQTGEFVGSLAYAAPEQFRPEDEGIGPAADLYAFGVVLFELATGKSPFPLGDLATLIRQKLQGGVPSPRSVHADVGAFWNEVIVKATRTEISERFASVAEMRRVLLEGETGSWWRARTAHLVQPVADRALERLRLERAAPLLGRTEAFGALEGAWARARAQGGALLLGGPSGVGKSRLVYELIERVAVADAPRVAAGRSVGAGGRSYQPFVEAFLDLLLPGEVDPAARREALLERLLPLLPDAPGLVPRFADFLLGGAQPGVEGGGSKDAVLVAFAHVLQRLAKERPVLLVIEDLHLAGAESVELFRHLARGVEGRPILLLGVHSEDEVAEGTPLDELVRAGGPVERMTLAPLDDAATEDLVRAVVKTERTVRALARPLYVRAEGNPLFVLETLANLKADGALVPRGPGLELVRSLDDLSVARSMRDLVTLRLSRLEDEQRETLEAAAVIGYEFDAPLLAAVLGENRLQLLKRLAALERRHRLLVGAGGSAFRFATRALYEATVGAINPALRGEYHALIADTLIERSKQGEGSPDRATSYALLLHLFHAGRVRETEPYVDAALEHMAATLHAGYAAPFLEKLAAAYAKVSASKQLAIALRLWSFYELLASRADQVRVLEVAQTLADKLGEPGPRARVHALRAGSYWYAGDWENAAAEAQKGLDLARAAGDRMWEATCHHTLGVVGYLRGDLKGNVASLEQALRIRREIGDLRGQASTLQSQGLVMAQVGREAEVLPTFEEALRIWREIGERRGEAVVLMNIGNHLVETSRYEEGVRYFEQAIGRHRETGALLNEAMALANLGFAQESLGRVEQAKTNWERALAIFVDQGNPNGELTVRTMMGSSLGAYGDEEEAARHLEVAIELATKKGAKGKLAAAHRALGRLLHGEGRRAEGWRHLERALALTVELNSVRDRVLTLLDMADAALTDHDLPRAESALTEALPEARRGSDTTAALALCRMARVHRESGRSAEASACAREALARLEASSALSLAQGPEIYSTLAEVLDGGSRREEFLARARSMAEGRARHIRSDSSRQRFLAQSRVGLDTFSGGRAEP